MTVRQVPPHDRFPSGDYRYLAEIRLPPEELAAQYGLEFEDLEDDLDAFKLAAIELADGSQAWFKKYRGDQYAGTLVQVDAGVDLARAKEQLARALGLSEEDFCWVAPELEGSPAPA